MEALIGIKDKHEQKNDSLSVNSYTTKSQKEKEIESLGEDNEMTYETNNTIQMKLIKELQDSVHIL